MSCRLCYKLSCHLSYPQDCRTSCAPYWSDFLLNTHFKGRNWEEEGGWRYSWLLLCSRLFEAVAMGASICFSYRMLNGRRYEYWRIKAPLRLKTFMSKGFWIRSSDMERNSLLEWMSLKQCTLSTLRSLPPPAYQCNGSSTLLPIRVVGEHSAQKSASRPPKSVRLYCLHIWWSFSVIRGD